MRAVLLACLVAVFQSVGASAAEPATMPLAGKWRFALDPRDEGVAGKWFGKKLEKSIQLPGILQAQGYGDPVGPETPWVSGLHDRSWQLRAGYLPYAVPGKTRVPFLCQPVRHYLGPAWYQRDLTLPAGSEAGRRVLFLERARWETRVWIDGREVGACDSLVAPHAHDLGLLESGTYQTTIRVDNRMLLPYRPDSHAVSDSMGGTWNGIVGKIELRSTPAVWLDDVRVGLDNGSAKVSVRIGNATGKPGTGRVACGTASAGARWDATGGAAGLLVKPPPGTPLWDELRPATFPLAVTLDSSAGKHRVEVTTALRPIVQPVDDWNRNWKLGMIYPEVITWYGALSAAGLAYDKDLGGKLAGKFDAHLTAEGAEHINPAAHVDYRVFGIVPLEIHFRTGDPRCLELGKRMADAQWSATTPDGITTEARYWIDDMYMIPALQTLAFRATRDPVYLDRAALTMSSYLDRLQQPNGLCHHGADSPFFWSRGNGWMAAGSAELLASLPAGHPRRERILAGYRMMMKSLLDYQASDGLWRQLIDKPESWPESSGSAMFAFGMVTGVKQGWLDETAYGPAARKAWLALAGLLDENANLRKVCVGTNKGKDEPYCLARPRVTDYSIFLDEETLTLFAVPEACGRPHRGLATIASGGPRMMGLHGRPDGDPSRQFPGLRRPAGGISPGMTPARKRQGSVCGIPPGRCGAGIDARANSAMCHSGSAGTGLPNGAVVVDHHFSRAPTIAPKPGWLLPEPRLR